MSRIITFSRFFPKGHPKQGQPTYFIEKIHKSLDEGKQPSNRTLVPGEALDLFGFSNYNTCAPKHHTIRSGNRWKVGDKFSPRAWSGAPYRSNQIQFAPDIEIKKIWNFKTEGELFFLNEKGIDVTSCDLPKNDGLYQDDFMDWFDMYTKKAPFNGQIICWNNSIEYT